MASLYTKPQLSVTEQISLLKQEGLPILNEDLACHLLQNISLFRLKSYISYLRQRNSKKFKPGATFEQAFSLYQFDSELRKMVHAELEKIEVSVRTQLSLIMSETAGIFWFTESENFKNKEIHQLLLHNLYKELRRSDEEAFLKFQNTYKNEFPPSWMTFEISSFGTLSIIYRYLKSSHARRQFAKFYGLSDPVMESWLHSIVYIRNICAHHGRLWNKRLSINPMTPRTPHLPFIHGTPNDTKKVYYALSFPEKS
jgi:abortive infection bacteriophage resistance protein